MSMKKEKRIFALTIIGLLMVSFLVGVVSAATAWEEFWGLLSGGEKAAPGLANAFSDFFSKSGWTQGKLEANIAKIFFFVILIFVIYLLISSLFPRATVITSIISILVAFLATAYITPDEIYSVLISYTALGLTLSTLLPLAIMMGLTYRAIVAIEGKAALLILQFIGWILFAAYSVYRVIYGIYVAEEGYIWTNWIILAIAVLALIMVIFNKWIIKSIAHAYIESSEEAARETVDKATSFLKTAARGQEKLAGKGRP